MGPEQVTLFERVIAFLRFTVELQLCGNVDFKFFFRFVVIRIIRMLKIFIVIFLILKSLINPTMKSERKILLHTSIIPI